MMPRIEDIGVFNTVRESGMSKLLPTDPRIAVGMGTCGHATERTLQREIETIRAGE